MEHVVTVLTVIILTEKSMRERDREIRKKSTITVVTITVRSVGTHPAAGDYCTPRMACRRMAKSALGWSETVAHYSVHSVMAGSRRKSLGSLETRWPVRKWLFHRAEALIYPCQGGERIIKRKLAAVTEVRERKRRRDK